MKTSFTILAALISVLATAQTNKPGMGDFGIRYSVLFNGGAVQALTFSGMVTHRWEVGSTFNIQYSQSTSNNTYATYVFEGNTEVPALETSTGSSKTLTLNISPYVVYHFPTHSNLDIYLGGNVTVGTSPLTLSGNSNSTTQAPDYLYQEMSSATYPFGYQVGAGVIVGGQYYFYKKLALGVSANLAAVYMGRKGTQTTFGQNINTGSQNSNAPSNTSETYYTEFDAHSFSLTNNSGVGVTLTFYVSSVKKAKKEKEQ